MVSESLFRLDDSQFSVFIMLGAEDNKDTVENVDIELALPDGTRWSGTFITLRAIDAVMNRWKISGECSAGAYFQCSDLVIIPNGGLEAILDSLNGIIESGGPEGFLQLLSDN